MRGINKVILVGNVGKSPDLRYTKNGKAVANFSLATNRVRSRGDGEAEETTEWHRIVVFGRQGEVAGQLVHKGTPLYIEGRLVPTQWTDKEGNPRRGSEIWADQMQLLGRRGPADGVTAPTLTEGASVPMEDVPF